MGKSPKPNRRSKSPGTGKKRSGRHVTFGKAISQDGEVFRRCAIRLGKAYVDDSDCKAKPPKRIKHRTR